MGQIELFNFMKANQGVWFTIEMLAKITSMQVSQTSKCLNKMLNYDDLFGLEQKHELEKREETNRQFTIKYYRVKPTFVIFKG